MSSENLKLARTTITALIVVLTAFSGFWGVGTIITRIEDLRVQQALLGLQMKVVQGQLDEMKAMQEKYWKELQLTEWRNQHFMDRLKKH